MKHTQSIFILHTVTYFLTRQIFGEVSVSLLLAGQIFLEFWIIQFETLENI